MPKLFLIKPFSVAFLTCSNVLSYLLPYTIWAPRKAKRVNNPTQNHSFVKAWISYVWHYTCQHCRPFFSFLRDPLYVFAESKPLVKSYTHTLYAFGWCYFCSAHSKTCMCSLLRLRFMMMASVFWGARHKLFPAINSVIRLKCSFTFVTRACSSFPVITSGRSSVYPTA